MENKECAKWLIEMYAEYADLANRYGIPFISEYSEAVAKAVMMLGGRKDND
jgi:hypothetical protein